MYYTLTIWILDQSGYHDKISAYDKHPWAGCNTQMTSTQELVIIYNTWNGIVINKVILKLLNNFITIATFKKIDKIKILSKFAETQSWVFPSKNIFLKVGGT